MRDTENLTVEAKGLIAPLADLHPHHLVEEVEAEAEAEGHTPAQNPLAAKRTHGNVSTNTRLGTSAQSALAGGSERRKRQKA
jgi:hypothetical protein